MPSTYTLEVVSYNGSWQVDATLTPNARIEEITDELNGLGVMSFTIPVNDANVSHIQPLVKEVRVKRGGTVIWWGIPVRADATWSELRVQCYGLGYYFARRYIGNTGKVNLVSNPSFETGTTGWTFRDTTYSRVTTHRFHGSYGLNLAQNTAGKDAYAEINVVNNVTGAAGTGTTLTAIAWVHIRADTYQSTLYPQQFNGAYADRGLTLHTVDSATGQTLKSFAVAPLAPSIADHQMGRSVRLETSVTIPPGETQNVWLRLYSPQGDVVWDWVQVYTVEAFSYPRTDIATVAQKLAEYAQNPDYGKSDEHIGTSCPATGNVIDVTYRHVDHVNIGDALASLTKMDPGIDWWIEPATRTFTTASQKGTTRSWTAQAGTSATISEFVYNWDGEAGANSVYALAEFQDMIRDEGIARDLSTLGTHAWEDIMIADTDSTQQVLQAMAAKRLSKVKHGGRVLEVKALPDQATVVNDVTTGDRVTVNLSRGWVNLSGTWRVIRKTVDPASDEVTLVLHPV